MRKRVYISADYDDDSGDRVVVDMLNMWGNDDLHKVDFVDMAKVVSGSVSNESDCRACELKQEFNNQINLSSAVICIIGDKTASRTAGSSCERVNKNQSNSICTPYKQNANGKKMCKYSYTRPAIDNVGNINNYSYLRHEFEQAKLKNKQIIIFYNSLRKESNWLPFYMKDYELQAEPFWIKNADGKKVGNYAFLKQALGYK